MGREVTMVLALLFACTGVPPSATNTLPSTAPCPARPACPNITACDPCPAPITCPPLPLPVPAVVPILGLLKVKGDSSTCRGVVYLVVNGSYGLPVCRDSAQWVSTGALCQQLGCGRYHQQMAARRSMEGYHIRANGSLETGTCSALELHCSARADSRELVAYKAVTGLLLGLFLFLLLLRTGPQILSYIRKRYQSSTWIGPRQSQTVSFYRAQGALPPNSSTSKRLSYPALERLAINASRDPPSNRNSDCDSYN